MRGGDDLMRQQVWIVVRRSIGRVMEIVKLAHGRDAGAHHLEKAHARYVIDVLRRKPSSGLIHRVAP